MARNRFDQDEALSTPFKLKHLWRCLKYVGKYKWSALTALLLGSAGSIIGLTGPLLVQEALDVAVPAKDTAYLIELSVILAATVIINTVLSIVRGRLLARVGQNVVYDMRRDIFNHLQDLPFSYYDNLPHGKILIRVTHYVNSVSDLISNGLINFLIELTNIVFIIIFMIKVNAPLALIIMAGLPVFIIFVTIIKPRQRKAWQNVSNKTSNTNAYVQESIDGVNVIQAFNRQEENAKTMDKLTDDARHTWFKAIYVTNTVWFSVETISQLVFSLVYIAGVYWMVPVVTFGTVLAMANYAQKFWSPITSIANIYNTFINTIAYIERIFQTIDEPVSILDKPGADVLCNVTGDVRFDHVEFSYTEGQPILKDICFDVKSGEKIALVGPTGAGKTTIINLLARFYDANSGEISIDDHNICDVTIASLRGSMGIMLQESFIFSGTVMDNIRYGRLDATDEEVIEAAKTVHAHEFILTLKDGYNTVVGERGGSLSQGQKQLISFARTLLADPKILILDEATSSIDTATEKQVQAAVDTVCRGRTSFIVAHRLSTIKNCDRIMYIDSGAIAESGTHDELLAKRGLYYTLYTSQGCAMDK